MAFSSMLKHLREERRLSQKDIADYLGITRQAVASYELAKREPDYEILRKLADYFDVSVDYLLGRANSRELNAFTVGKNIELIKGKLTYEELSESINRKTGVLIFPEMLELYARGERMPLTGTVKILAKYAGVHEAFFYTYNTCETYEQEKHLFQVEREKFGIDKDTVLRSAFNNIDKEIKQWIIEKDNIKYILLAKEIQEAGLPVDVFKPFIESFKTNKKAFSADDV